jgi:hypothetical protein
LSMASRNIASSMPDLRVKRWNTLVLNIRIHALSLLYRDGLYIALSAIFVKGLYRRGLASASI